MKKYDVYCDESYPDIFTTKNPKTPYLFIGGLKLPTEKREEIKEKIKKLKIAHNINVELKWKKVSKQRDGFYKALIDLFFEYGVDLSFRCIIVDSSKINWDMHNQDKELGFYKFYYEMLEHWLDASSQSEFAIFCDHKTNKNKGQIQEFKKILRNHHRISEMQQIPSYQSVLLQFSDFLLGFITAKTNRLIKNDGYKQELIDYFEKKHGKTLSETVRSEKKYNVFNIRLRC